jgi:hypothetical protein
MIFSVTPGFVVNVGNGTEAFSMPQFTGSMAFASPSQFSCYKLQGTTLIKALDGAGVLPYVEDNGDENFHGWADNSVWCL